MQDRRKKDAALPVGPDWFAESILTGNPYRAQGHRHRWATRSSAAPTRRRCRRRSRSSTFYVYTGLFMEEPAYYADVILPVCSGLEMEGVYMRRDDRAIRWQKQAVPRVGESKTDWEIWIDLAHAMAKLDTKNPPEYWTDNFPAEWKDYRKLWATFVAKHTPGMGGMTQSAWRSAPSRCAGRARREKHPGVSTLYLDHPSWYEAAEALDPANKGKRFLTPSGKVEIFTPDLEKKLAAAGHRRAADLLHAPGGHGQEPDHRVPERAGAEPGQPRRADAEGEARRRCPTARSTRSSRSWA